MSPMTPAGPMSEAYWVSLILVLAGHRSLRERLVEARRETHPPQSHERIAAELSTDLRAIAAGAGAPPPKYITQKSVWRWCNQEYRIEGPSSPTRPLPPPSEQPGSGDA